MNIIRMMTNYIYILNVLYVDTSKDQRKTVSSHNELPRERYRRLR